MNPRNAYVTLLTKDSYLAGTLVLHYGLRAVKSKYPLVAMVTSSLPEDVRTIVQEQGIQLREVEPLKSAASNFNPYDKRFENVWTKLRAFELDEYDRVVLLDCDMIIKRNMDELFDIELPKDGIAAAHVCACNPRKLPHYPPDWIPENCAHSAVTRPTDLPPTPTDESPRPHGQLNSGTVILNPSKYVAHEIYHYLDTSDLVPTFSFADQDLLAVFFKGKWRPIQWYYNALKTLRILHPREWSDDEVRCVHYIFPEKPWQRRIPSLEMEEDYKVLHGWWWKQFDELGNEMKAVNPKGWNLVASTVDTLH
ncbi:hypothetical protein AX15_007165 [Amanita polypyramis BW_CC]|nr:hypothetical protein AX15_007165 [Amanita polypyramis BW_CC]